MTNKENTGILFRNDKKAKDSHPDFRGNGNFNGVDFDVSAWVKEDKNGNKFFSLSFQPPYKKEEKKKEEVTDDFPF